MFENEDQDLRRKIRTRDEDLGVIFTEGIFRVLEEWFIYSNSKKKAESRCVKILYSRLISFFLSSVHCHLGFL